MRHQAIIVLGSNIDPQTNMKRALDLLQERFEVQKISSILRTTPVGITNQPDFFNAAVWLATTLLQEGLRQRLKVIENEMGRDRSRPKYGPREIDLDIVVWDGEIVDDDYYQRDFLRQLVAELMS
ncbi:2-amino-4-hydroxy-6-hydroxymethyldihydropteridine diphosphokinase [Thermophagus sp. OGC60D27]|uniref:2-amino-4-hydroxy-6- hydroxymethyldihydropteridine diphosphokinase n=1 Tax=Thermophagus sp. OGC60D27 TaxID=3458415 RepID=UPI004037BD0F